MATAFTAPAHVQTVATTGAILSEFRFRGATGPADEFVELHNTTGSPLNISGWSIKTNTGTALSPNFQTALVPANTLVPPLGYFLFTGSGYSLSGYGQSDQSLGADVSDDSGVALSNAAGVLQDAVGFTTSVLGLREGAGLASAPTANGQYAFAREFNASEHKNSADSSQDFVLVLAQADATNPALLATIPGTGGAVVSQVGAPSPEGLTSPVYVNSQVENTLLDLSVSSSAAPNRAIFRDPDPGPVTEILVRRTLTNNGSLALRRVHFAVTRITALGSAGSANPAQADVRLISSTDETRANGNPVTLSNGTKVDVYGISLEAPSKPVPGGGLASSLHFDAVLSTPLLPGQSRNFGFLLKILKSGTYQVAFNIKALQALPLPPPVPILRGISGANQVALRWTAVRGASGYRIERKVGANGTYAELVSHLTTRLAEASYLDTKLTNGVTYSYRVYAVNSTGASPPSNEVGVTPGLVPPLGAFETPVLPDGQYQIFPKIDTDWTFDAGSGIARNGSGYDNGAAPEGVQVATLQGTGSIKRTFSVAEPGLYALRFYAASRRGEIDDFVVKIDGSVVGQYTANNDPNAPLGNWIEVVTAPFTLTAGAHEVGLAGLNSGGGVHNTIFVDDVRLEPALAAPPRSLIQGGFETPRLPGGSYRATHLPGSAWSFDAKSGIAGNKSTLNNGTAPQGVQVAFLQPAGAIKQSVSLPRGTYSLRFLYASRGQTTDTYSRPASFTVRFNGEVVGQFISTNRSPGNWAAIATAPISVAATGVYEISITSNNGSAPDGPEPLHTLFVDQVQLVNPLQPAVVPLSPPTDLRALPQSNAVELSWTPALGATGYAVQRAASPLGPWIEVARVSDTAARSANTVVTDTGVENGTLYFYTVTSLRARLEAATPLIPFPVDQSAPTAPVSALPGATLLTPSRLVAQGLVAAGGGTAVGGQVRLFWEAAAGATHYEVARQNGATWQVLNTTTGTTYTDAGLPLAATYTYVVRSRQGTTSSADSNQAQVSLESPPAAPTLTASAITAAGTAQIRLDWSASPGAGAYLVQRSTQSGGPYALLERAAASPYVDTRVESGKTYFYIVQASAAQTGQIEGRGDVVSAASNEASATAQNRPNTPLQLRASPGDGQILLEWQGNRDGSASVSGYQVWRSANAGVWSQIATLTANTEFYLDRGLTNGVPQTYLVRAVSGSGAGGASDTITARPEAIPAPRPDKVRIGLRTTTSIEVLLPAYRAATLSVQIGVTGGEDSFITAATGLSGGSAYTVTGLTPGANYWLRCVAESVSGAVFGDFVDTSTLQGVPDPPGRPYFTELRWNPNGTISLNVLPFAVPPRTQSLRLQRQVNSPTGFSWQNVYGAEANLVQGNTEGGMGNNYGTGFSVPGLGANTTYTFRLVASNDEGETAGPAGSITTLPAQPEIPVAEAITSTGLRVQRVATGQSVPPLPAGATSLTLQLLVNESEWRTVATGLIGNAAYTFGDLSPYTVLKLRYVSVGAAGQSPGGLVTVSTAAGTSSATPAQPLFTEIGSESLIAHRLFGYPYENEAGWVLQKLDGTTYVDLAPAVELTGEDLFKSVSGLSANTNYTFRFRVGATFGPANTVRTAPEAPLAPAITAVRETGVDLTLPSVPGNVTLTLQFSDGNQPYYSFGDPDIGWITAATGLTGGTNASINSLLPGARTRFRAIAVGPDASTRGAEAGPVTLLPPAPAPLAPKVGPAGPTTIVVPLSCATLYTLETWVEWKEAAQTTWNESVPVTTFPQVVYLGALQPATTYHVRLKVTGSNGTAYYSGVATFSTSPAAPPVPNVVDGSTTETSFQVLVPPALPMGASTLAVQIERIDSDNIDFWQTAATDVVPGQTPSPITVSGLSQGNAYRVRWVASGPTGQTAGGEAETYTPGNANTAPAAPLFSDVTPTGVTVWPSIESNYYSSSLIYKLQGKLASDTDYADFSGFGYLTNADFHRLEDLIPGATYQFRYVQTDSPEPEAIATETVGAVASLTMPTAASVTWDAGTGISCGGIRYPSENMTITSGQLGHLNSLLATDWDVIQRVVNGLPMGKDVTDTCSYTWSASGGLFPDGSSGPNVRWQAPTVTATTFHTVTLTVSDQASANKGAADAGSRADVARGGADQPLRFSVRVKVMP